MKKKKIALIILIVLLAVVAIAYTSNILVKWIIGNAPPVITLIHPMHNQTFYNHTIKFNWTSYDPNGDYLTHAWYADTTSAMNSPNFRAVNVGNKTELNYTFPYDGIWYWKVEVTDNKTIVTSETRSFKVWKYTTNHFPELKDGIVFPSVGTTSTIFTYLVTYYDPDGDLPEYVRVIIDGFEFDMQTTDNVQYYYSTTLPPGTHWYSFVASDGKAVCSLPKQTGPKVYGEGEMYANTPPQITLISPENGEVFTDRNVTFRWSIYDAEDNYVRSELWLYKDNLTAPRKVYEIDPGTTLQLRSGTYYWRICAYDTFTYNLSEVWMFSVEVPEKRCKVSLEPDTTEVYAGDVLTGNIVITNLGEAEVYEVYWYLTLENTTKWGEVTISATTVIPFSLKVPEDLNGSYVLEVKVYDKPREQIDANLLGSDSVTINVKQRVVLKKVDLTLAFLSVIVMSLVLAIWINKWIALGSIYALTGMAIYNNYVDLPSAILIAIVLTVISVVLLRKLKTARLLGYYRK